MRGELIHEDRPPFDWWLKLILGGVLALTFALGMAFIFIDLAETAVMFGVTLFDGLLFYFIMPRSYLIYADILVIKLGGPFSLKIKLADIKSAARASGVNALGSSGIRFATATGYVVRITRYHGMDVIISPGRGEIFLEQLERAGQDAKRRGTHLK
jgi:hypothetical protein